MPQYDIAFAEKLSQVANFVLDDGIEDLEAQRTVLYLSLLSTEIALKSMLEKAGKPVGEIRSRSHNLAELLKDLGQCEIQEEVVPGQLKSVSASRLRAKTLQQGEAKVTFGAIIDTKPNQASKYPNEVRYGEQLRHYPPAVVAQMASTVVAFAREHWSGLHAK
jgi:HEPN domain-containing protein